MTKSNQNMWGKRADIIIYLKGLDSAARQDFLDSLEPADARVVMGMMDNPFMTIREIAEPHGVNPKDCIKRVHSVLMRVKHGMQERSVDIKEVKRRANSIAVAAGFNPPFPEDYREIQESNS